MTYIYIINFNHMAHLTVFLEMLISESDCVVGIIIYICTHTIYTYIIINPNDFEPPLPCLILDDAGHQPALRAAHVLRFNDNLIQPRCFVFGCHGYFGAAVLFRLEH